MGIFRKKSNILIAVAVYILLFAGSIFLVSTFRTQIGAFVFPKIMAMDKNKDKEPAREVGIVNYEKLITEHPDYSELQRYDSEISSMSPNPFDPKQLMEFNEDLAKKFDKFRKEMEKELITEGERIKQDSRREVEALQQKTNQIATQKKNEFIKYQQALQAEYSKKQSDPNRPMTKWEKDFQKRVEDQTRDLRKLVEQQVTAKRLELEKDSRERLVAEEKKLEKEISSYEDSIMRENRDLKVNLQLKVTTAKDDEERQRIQDELNNLNREEEKKVSERRKEVTGRFQEIQDKEKARNNRELEAYRTKLEKDYINQIKSVRNKVGNSMLHEKVKKEGREALIPADIRKKLQDKRNQIEVEMKALGAQTNAKIAEIEARAKARFEQAKQKLNKKLTEYRKQLSEEFEAKKKEMIEQQVSANKEKEKAWQKLKDARDRKYKQMLEDINQKVEEVAREKNVKLVIGTYTVNVDGVDLNTPAMSAVRKMK